MKIQPFQWRTILTNIPLDEIAIRRALALIIIDFENYASATTHGENFSPAWTLSDVLDGVSR